MYYAAGQLHWLPFYLMEIFCLLVRADDFDETGRWLMSWCVCRFDAHAGCFAALITPVCHFRC